MTIDEFKQAKEILANLQMVNKNIEALDNAIDDSYVCPSNKPRHKLILERSVTIEELDVDIKFIEMALEYYIKEGSRLEAEFALIGKES